MPYTHTNQEKSRPKPVYTKDHSDLILFGNCSQPIDWPDPDFVDYSDPPSTCKWIPDSSAVPNPRLQGSQGANELKQPILGRSNTAIVNAAVRRPHSRTNNSDISIAERLVSRCSNSAANVPTCAQPLSVKGTRRSDYSRPHSQMICDPDHEQITDVLSRLGEYTQNFTPIQAVAYTYCECESEERKLSSRMAKIYDSQSESDSDDDEGVSFDILLRTFRQSEDLGHSEIREKALKSMIQSYNTYVELSEHQIQQLMSLLITSVAHVQKACLLLLKQCIKNTVNLQHLVNMKVLDYLYGCLTEPQLFHLRIPVLALMETIYACPLYLGQWYGVTTDIIIPILDAMLKTDGTPLDVKYSTCCVFRSLSMYEDWISLIINDILPCILNMRNTNAKFKEVYVEILTGIVSHTELVPFNLIDSSAIPITASIIREGPCGPQSASLFLLSILAIADSGVAMVISTTTMVAMLVCCIKESRCRKVRLNAVDVMCKMCMVRKLGMCKDLMVQLSEYLVPQMNKESRTSLSRMATPANVYPTKPRYDDQRHIWQGLEKFVEIIKTKIFTEARVTVDDLGLLKEVHITPCIDVCPYQLGMISHSLQVLEYICLWPLDKSRLGFSANKVNLSSFTDDVKQIAKLSKVNRGLTQSIWDEVGLLVTHLLSAYSNKFSSALKKKSADKEHKSSYYIETVFEAQEVTLIKQLLQLVLCTSLCTCVAFPDVMPELKEEGGKRKSKYNSNVRSCSTSYIKDSKSNGSATELPLKSKSDTAKGFVMDDNSASGQDNGRNTVTALNNKEASTDRRLLRICLYEADVFRSICPFMMCNDEDIQILLLQILRCLIQPLEERVAPPMHSSNKKNLRPQTTGSRRLNMALFKMSQNTAEVIGEALKCEVSHLSIPHANYDMKDDGEKMQDTKSGENSATDDQQSAVIKKRDRPMIDRYQPIVQQCRQALLKEAGDRLFSGIFTKSPAIKKYALLLLHDFVHYGEASTTVSLSKFGCIPRFLDFLRVNENNELLEIIGLITVRLLVNRDHRMKQLFDRHGGPKLLLSMVQYTNGLLKQEVSTTLRVFTHAETVRKRPVSAPVQRSPEAAEVPDVWQQIQSRWEQEDQVTNVLRQWMISDKARQKASCARR